MEFIKGSNWTACREEKSSFYSAAVWGFGVSLYEINETIYNNLKDVKDESARGLITKGRRMYVEVIDSCGPPYTIVFDKEYKKLCPWFDEDSSSPKWPDEMVDAVIEVLDSEKANREKRKHG